MLRTLIVLPDGTELFSGVGEANAIQNVKITECVNGAQELTLGSCCANMIEAKILTPNGALSVAAGGELAVYRVADDGTRHKVGLFTTEKPTRPSANSMSITAYDRVSWLDKDLTSWLASLDGWPYALHDFAVMVCKACGLLLVNESIPNGGYPVQKFSADGITGRQLIQWVGEICGRFCRATPDGDIEFAWYTPATIALGAHQGIAPDTNVDISYANGTLSIQDSSAQVSYEEGILHIQSEHLQVSDDGQGKVVLTVRGSLQQQYFFQNGLSFEDYTVAPIEKVQLRQNEDDVGTVYPNISEEVNTYIITGNYLLTASTAEDLRPVAQSLYEHLADVTYTPCKVSIPTSLLIHAGNTVQITDRNGKSIIAYIMTRTQSGQKDTLECTGSAKRDSSTAVNNNSFKWLCGKVLNLRTDVEGLKVENKDTAGRVAELSVDVAGIGTAVSQQVNTAQGLQKQITEMQQDAEKVRITVTDIQENGTSKVKTESGYTFSDAGLIISKSGEEMENRLDNTGMYVERSGEVILQADHKGVVATDVKVRNFLVIGSHARFEDYTDGTDNRRTACFWLGEE